MVVLLVSFMGMLLVFHGFIVMKVGSALLILYWVKTLQYMYIMDWNPICPWNIAMFPGAIWFVFMSEVMFWARIR